MCVYVCDVCVCVMCVCVCVCGVYVMCVCVMCVCVWCVYVMCVYVMCVYVMCVYVMCVCVKEFDRAATKRVGRMFDRVNGALYEGRGSGYQQTDRECREWAETFPHFE